MFGRRFKLLGVPIALAALVLLLGRIAATRASITNTIASAEIGQVDFVHATSNYVRPHSLAGPFGGGIESTDIAVDRVNGRLWVVDTNNSRVLAWASVSSFTNGQGADLVIGQPDFYSITCNATGLGLTELCNPSGVAVDQNGTVYVGDKGNGRVVVYSDPFKQTLPVTGSFYLAGEDEVAVDAAGDVFATNTVNSEIYEYDAPVTSSSTVAMTFSGGGFGLSASNLANPHGVAIDGAGNVYIADSVNSRVLEFDNAVKTRNTTANHVLGQPDFTTNTAAAGTTGMGGPDAVSIDPNGNLWVADRGNNRVLEFNTPATYSGTVPEPASLVIGQPNFTDLNCNQGGVIPTATSICNPFGVAADSSGNVYVDDFNNARVLEYNESANPPTNATANRELGQNDFVHNTPNFEDSESLHTDALNQTNGIGVAGIAVDTHSTPNHLYVVDTNNQRVLGFRDAATFSNSAGADLVIGQPDFYSALCYLPDAVTFCFTALGGAAVDSLGNLYVADAGESRVLEFPPPFSQPSGGPYEAERELGEPDFFTIDGCGAATASNSILCQPIGVALDASDNLYVADSGNSRVLEFPRPNAYAGPTPEPAAVVFGQRGSFTTNTCQDAPITAQDMCYPTALAFDGAGDLYVTDRLFNRAVEFNNPLANPKTPNTTADLVFGQGATGTNFSTFSCLATPSATQMCGVAGVAVDSANTVYISDSKYSRTLSFLETSLPPTNVTPNLVLGQGSAGTSFTTRVCAASDDTMCEVTGTAVDNNGNLYVNDKGADRVLRFDQPNGPVPTVTASATPSATATPTATATATRTATPTATATPVDAKLEISPKSVNFGNKTAVDAVSKPKTVTIKNGSSKNSRITVSISGESAASPFAVGSECSTSLAPGRECKVSVTFTPPNTALQTGTLTINDDEQGAPQKIGLSGSGKAGKKKK